MIEYDNLKKSNEIFLEDFRNNFEEVLQKGWFILGEHVQKFEEKFSNYCGSDYCVGVASGLDALSLSISAFDFPSGSEIIVASNTYIASIMAIIRANCVPVFVEPDIKTYNIDVSRIEEKITNNTKAIMAVHLYGKACEMSVIQSIAQHYDLNIIEDCAQAHGSKFNGQSVGTFGIGCFSFYPTKNLGALGDAGAITCRSEYFAEKIKSLRNYGSVVKYRNDDLGYNSRLDELQASFLLTKLKYLDDITLHKRNLADIYMKNLSEDFIKPTSSPENYDVYHIYNIRHEKRDLLKQYLHSKGIGTEIHYPIPPHKQKCLRPFVQGDFPISEIIHDTTLSLPISFYHKEDDVMKVCEVMNAWDQK